ncbi:MAG: hypothetical protein CME20_16110, partial [Gemmatimonadetes bacterium]|nr:hypothetical protein [Gemmatimonadota bacterium]
MSLDAKIRRGLALVFFSTMGSRVASFGADIYLTRLLAVEVFGIMAIGLLVVNALVLLRSLGVGEALIFRDEVEADSADTALWISLVLGAFTGGLVYAVAPWLAAWLAGDHPALAVEVLRVLALLVLLQAAGSVPGALLERELAFDKRLYVDTLPALLYALLAVGLALAGFGIWSMVWGRLASGLVAAVAAWWCASWRPQWCWSWERFRQLGGYGRYAAGAAVVSFLVVNIDDVLVA